MVKPERTVTIRDMAGFIENASIEIASQKIGHWIREGILLPKASGERRNAVYPFENIQRLTTLEEAGLLRVGVRPRYAGLRLTLWLKGFSLESKLIKEDVKEALMAVAKEGLANSSDILAKDEKIVNGFSKLFGVDKEAVRKKRFLNEDTINIGIENLASKLPAIGEAEDTTNPYHFSESYSLKAKAMGSTNTREVIPLIADRTITEVGEIEPQEIMAMVKDYQWLTFEDLIAFVDVIETQQAFRLVGLNVTHMLSLLHPKPYVLPNTNPKLFNFAVYSVIAGITISLTKAEQLKGVGFIQGLLQRTGKDERLAEALKMAGKDE